jgi:hypothetical protein
LGVAVERSLKLYLKKPPINGAARQDKTQYAAIQPMTLTDLLPDAPFRFGVYEARRDKVSLAAVTTGSAVSASDYPQAPTAALSALLGTAFGRRSAHPEKLDVGRIMRKQQRRNFATRGTPPCTFTPASDAVMAEDQKSRWHPFDALLEALTHGDRGALEMTKKHLQIRRAGRDPIVERSPEHGWTVRDPLVGH